MVDYSPNMDINSNVLFKHYHTQIQPAKSNLDEIKIAKCKENIRKIDQPSPTRNLASNPKVNLTLQTPTTPLSMGSKGQ